MWWLLELWPRAEQASATGLGHADDLAINRAFAERQRSAHGACGDIRLDFDERVPTPRACGNVGSTISGAATRTANVTCLGERVIAGRVDRGHGWRDK